MANNEDVERLRQGLEAWNDWRARDPERPVDLSGMNLSGAKLSGAGLWRANLHKADLSEADSHGRKPHQGRP